MRLALASELAGPAAPEYGQGSLPPPTSDRYSTINDIAGIVLASRLPHAFQVAVLQGWQRFPEAASVTLEDLPRSVLF